MSKISGIVVLETVRDVVFGIEVVVVSLVVVLSLRVIAAVGAAEDVVIMGAQVGETGCWAGWLLGGKMWRYLGGGPGRRRRLELGQLCRAHSDLDQGLVERSQVFLGANVHVTVRERTPPPHVTGHCEMEEHKYSNSEKIKKTRVRKIKATEKQESRLRNRANLEKEYLFPDADSPVLSTGHISIAWQYRLGFKEMLALDRVEHPFLP